MWRCPPTQRVAESRTRSPERQAARQDQRRPGQQLGEGTARPRAPQLRSPAIPPPTQGSDDRRAEDASARWCPPTQHEAGSRTRSPERHAARPSQEGSSNSVTRTPPHKTCTSQLRSPTTPLHTQGHGGRRAETNASKNKPARARHPPAHPSSEPPRRATCIARS